MDVEILVHISAPTTHKDDERYRAMADAYADFEPHDPEGSGLAEAVAESPVAQTPEWNSQESASYSRRPSSGIISNGPPTPTFVESFATTNAESPGSDDYYGSFPSFMSAKVQEDSDKINLSFPLGSDENTSPSRSRLEQLERIHARWKRATPRSSVVQGSGDVYYQNVKSPTDDAPLFIEDTQLAEQALETQVYDGLFTSYPSDSELSFPVADLVQDPPNLENITDQPEPINVPIGEPYAASPQQQCLPEQLGVSSSQAEEKESHLVEQQINSEQDQRKEHDPEFIENASDDDWVEFCSFPSEIFAPPPQISIQKPGRLPSLITNELKLVQQQNGARFQPVEKLRDLASDERGYWVVDPSGWALKAQFEFWSSLQKHVQQGRFGWGVTLHRGPQRMEVSKQVSPQGLGTLQLYCFGEIAEHIWLYMWLCSNGMIIGAQSRWIDADRVVVIQMP